MIEKSETHKSHEDMVTVVMTGCDSAADWQSIGLYYSFVR